MKRTNCASYVNDFKPTITAENLDDVNKSLEQDSIKLFQRFSDNQMRVDHDKCHFSVKNHVTMNVSGFKIKNTDCEKLFGIIVDCKPKCKNIQLLLLKS